MRSVVRWLCQQPWRWTVVSVSTMSRVTESRARAFITQLVKERVIVEEDGAYKAGPALQKWARERRCSHPGGNSLAYRNAAAERAATYQQQHEERMLLAEQLRKKRGKRSVASIARLANISHSVLFDLEAGRVTVRTSTLARIFQALEDRCQEN